MAKPNINEIPQPKRIEMVVEGLKELREQTAALLFDMPTYAMEVDFKFDKMITRLSHISHIATDAGKPKVDEPVKPFIKHTAGVPVATGNEVKTFTPAIPAANEVEAFQKSVAECIADMKKLPAEAVMGKYPERIIHGAAVAAGVDLESTASITEPIVLSIQEALKAKS